MAGTDRRQLLGGAGALATLVAGSRAFSAGQAGLSVPTLGYAIGDCQEFRVWLGIMGEKETHYVETERACDTE